MLNLNEIANSQDLSAGKSSPKNGSKRAKITLMETAGRQVETNNSHSGDRENESIDGEVRTHSRRHYQVDNLV